MSTWIVCNGYVPKQNLLDTRLSDATFDHSEMVLDQVKILSASSEAIAMEIMKIRVFVSVSL